MAMRYKTVVIQAQANQETYMDAKEQLAPLEGEKVIIHSMHIAPANAEVGFIRLYLGETLIVDEYHAAIDDSSHEISPIKEESGKEPFKVSVFSSQAYTVYVVLGYEKIK